MNWNKSGIDLYKVFERCSADPSFHTSHYEIDTKWNLYCALELIDRWKRCLNGF